MRRYSLPNVRTITFIKGLVRKEIKTLLQCQTVSETSDSFVAKCKSNISTDLSANHTKSPFYYTISCGSVLKAFASVRLTSLQAIKTNVRSL